MRANDLQISTPIAVLRFDCMVGRKPATTPLLLVLEVCNVKPTYRKSWAGNLLMWSDLTMGPSFKVKQDKKVKSADNSLIIGPRGLQYETNLWETMS